MRLKRLPARLTRQVQAEQHPVVRSVTSTSPMLTVQVRPFRARLQSPRPQAVPGCRLGHPVSLRRPAEEAQRACATPIELQLIRHRARSTAPTDPDHHARSLHISTTSSRPTCSVSHHALCPARLLRTPRRHAPATIRFYVAPKWPFMTVDCQAVRSVASVQQCMALFARALQTFSPPPSLPAFKSTAPFTELTRRVDLSRELVDRLVAGLDRPSAREFDLESLPSR